MNTEITEYNNVTQAGWVCVDFQCPFCVRWARRAEPLLGRHGFAVVPLQADQVRAVLNVPETELLREMRVLTRRGEVFGGADALLYLARRTGWARPFGALARLPGVTPLLRAAYRFVAARRSCNGRACATGGLQKLHARTAGMKFIAWLPLVVLTLAAVAAGPRLPAWVWMWTLALALYAGCKWLTFFRAIRGGAKPGVGKATGYLLAWPGMDARTFFIAVPQPTKPTPADWLSAGLTVAAGVGIVAAGPRLLVANQPLLAGWLGMWGVILILHFGLFQMLALTWRVAGINAVPLMRRPLHSTSLADFWGNRWNTGFHRLAHDFIFRPLRRWLRPRGATFAAFGLSGAIHELLISVPARGGYGLPTVYFVAQAAGLLIERTPFGRRLGLGRGLRGWLFTVAVVAIPAFWLFPPVFIRNVILPMLRAIGAT